MKFIYLFLLYKRKMISRRRFLLLLCILKKRKLRDDWIPFAFDPSVFTERESWRFFRFTMSQIEELRKRLLIPDIVVTAERDRASGVEALCILLRRFVYPSRWIDLRMFFGRSEGSLCRIFMWVLNHIDRTFRWLVEEWNQTWLTEEDFVIFAGAVAAKGGVLRGCFGFIDGTARPISRPKFFQRQCFSGHKRHHCSKWQAVLLPNGMIGSLYGGHRGSMHDSTLLTSSKVLDALQQKFTTFAGPDRFCLYGNSGYGRGELVKKPFSKVEVLNDRRKKALNKAMSRVREPVEWGFKEVVSKFAFLDFKKQMRMYVNPINKLYRVAVILINCHNCLNHNQASQYFDLEPPSLEEYLVTFDE
ncbi:uncharacterized protein LOC129595112 [Paramacrobiotus metropolitanus]|uniref:uncharacterized protein LOC129595112 n=1 Tax=Paramacrobiotus metropolitanus TaxID=2943436 RepID=UPI002445AC50|nr:uncharacterized protein LOC129595112 [Paramacrobiotus metropolitanus]